MQRGTLLDYIERSSYDAARDRNGLVSLEAPSPTLSDDDCQLCGVANGLLYLHLQKIIHGDVKAVRSSAFALQLSSILTATARQIYLSTKKESRGWPTSDWSSSVKRLLDV